MDKMWLNRAAALSDSHAMDFIWLVVKQWKREIPQSMKIDRGKGRLKPGTWVLIGEIRMYFEGIIERISSKSSFYAYSDLIICNRDTLLSFEGGVENNPTFAVASQTNSDAKSNNSPTIPEMLLPILSITGSFTFNTVTGREQNILTIIKANPPINVTFS